MGNEKPHAECERSRQLRNSKMPPSLAHAIGAPAENEHADQARQKRNRAHPSDALNICPTGESLEHRRKPKPKRVPTGIGEEEPGSEHQHRWMSKRLPNRHLLRVRTRRVRVVSAPHVISVSDNKHRALQRSTSSAPGIWSAKYPMKKIPLAVPNTESLRPRSPFIPSVAYAMFVRSR